MSGSRRLEGWRIDDMAETLRVNEKAVDGWGGVLRKQRWEALVSSRKTPYGFSV